MRRCSAYDEPQMRHCDVCDEPQMRRCDVCDALPVSPAYTRSRKETAGRARDQQPSYRAWSSIKRRSEDRMTSAHDARPRTCNGCQADQFVCARKSALGGRACCERCSHVQVKKAEPR